MKLAGALLLASLLLGVIGSDRLAAAPGQAVLVGAAGAVQAGSPAVFSWNAVPGATWYYLWVNDRSGTQHTVWYSATQAGCGAGEAVCSVTVVSSLKAGGAVWWVRSWDPSGYGPWSAAGTFTVVSPADGGLRFIAQNGTTVGRMLDETKIVRAINGQLVMIRATAVGFMMEGVSLEYTTTNCTGQAYGRADLLPWLKLAGSVSNGFLYGSAVASRVHQSSRSISETGQVGNCSTSTSAFDSVPVAPFDATAEIGGLVGPFTVVQ